MTVKNCFFFTCGTDPRNLSQQPTPQSTSNLCQKPSADLRSDPEIADKTIDCLGLGISPEVDPTVRICAGCAERVDAQHAFRTRDLHCNSYVENGLEDKEDEDVCRFCLKADGGAALVELFPGGGGSVADEVQTVRDCLGVEINSWDMVTKICGDCVGGVEELAEFRAEFSPTAGTEAGTVKLEDVTDSSDSYSIGSENGEGGEGFESDSSTADNGEKRGGKAEDHGTVAAVDWK
ncbi:uncharacterized protein LOC120414800 [Culex pipiens pallens]|uniref:uncharacterized protein LOC120414800 n=1 Tax=Culex pipiens pallens TaxID=42434 RepID=UPI0022AAEAA9|nr:uncharacterized protein LOC120414800 [Culex pipiens pallens]